MADDDFPEDENEDFEDDDEGVEPEEPEEEPRRAKKKARKVRKPHIAKPPPMPDTPTPAIDPFEAEQRWHAHRLQTLYSEPLPDGMGMAQGLEGWDMEYEIIQAAGLQDAARLIIKRTKPPGPDMKPEDHGSLFPSQVPSGQALYDWLYEHCALPSQPVVIQWKLFHKHPLRLGEIRLPLKTARAPAPANGAFGAAPQERAGAGPHNAGVPGSLPPWGPAPAGYGGYPPPPGYYPPPQYPPPAPPRAEPPAPPPPVPTPAGTSPESVAYIRAMEAQLADMRERLWDRMQSPQQDTSETAQLRERLRQLEERLAQAAAPPPPPPAAAPPPPPAPQSFEDQLAEMERKMSAVESMRKRLVPDAPAAASAPAVTTVGSSDGDEEDGDVIQVVKSDGGPTMMVDRETKDVRWGMTAFGNLPIIQEMFKGVVDYVKKAAIEVKTTPAPGQGGGNGGQGSPPPVSGGSGAGKAFGS